MSELVIPNEEQTEEVKKNAIVVNYDPTEIDQEAFFLMYHMSMQPSEAYGLEPERRKWIIGCFIEQKKMEREAMVQHRMMQQIGPNLGLQL